MRKKIEKVLWAFVIVGGFVMVGVSGKIDAKVKSDLGFYAPVGSVVNDPVTGVRSKVMADGTLCPCRPPICRCEEAKDEEGNK